MLQIRSISPTLILVTIVTALSLNACDKNTPETGTKIRHRIPLAILGDSDSHSFHDYILIPDDHLKVAENSGIKHGNGMKY